MQMYSNKSKYGFIKGNARVLNKKSPVNTDETTQDFTIWKRVLPSVNMTWPASKYSSSNNRIRTCKIKSGFSLSHGALYSNDVNELHAN